MKILFFFAVMFAAVACQGQDSTALFPVTERNRTGFIDRSGRVIIKPVFRSANNFSEGLAAARINGLYGYIDRTGEFVIPPRYDYATDFKEGCALAYLGSKAVYIDKQGRILFETAFSNPQPFKNGLAVVHHASFGGMQGMINKQGKLVIDALYHSFERCDDAGLIIARAIDPQKGYDPDNMRVAVIDTAGNFIVPFGRFKNIGPFVQGVALARTLTKPEDSARTSSASVFIDTRGNILFDHGNRLEDGRLMTDMHDGIARIYFTNPGMPGPDDQALLHRFKHYEGYINSRGEILHRDSTVERTTEFSQGRAFVKILGQGYTLVDTQMNPVCPQKFSAVLDRFRNGYAFVAENGKYGLIDRQGEFAVRPQFDQIHRAGLIGDYFFFSGTESGRLYGVCDVSGKILLEPVLQTFDTEGFKDGLLLAVVDGKLTYVNKSGKMIPRLTHENDTEDLDLDYMNEVYLSWEENRKDRPEQKGILKKFPERQLSVHVSTDEPVPYRAKWSGYALYIVNTTDSAVQFNAIDGVLSMGLQAKDSAGVWKSIEHLPVSFCGNSYHTASLETMNYWKFSIPKYAGGQKTGMRVILVYRDPAYKGTDRRDPQASIAVYSNEFEGSVNPAQFWRRREHVPAGLLDTGRY